MDIREIVRRVQVGQSDREIARELGVNRKTVSGYRRFAAASGLLEAGGCRVASEEQLEEHLLSAGDEEQEGRRGRQESTVEPYRELVEEWLSCKLSIQVIYQRLQERGYGGSYTSVRRFVRRLRASEPGEAFARVEVGPGEEAQVDFGSAGEIYDRRQGKKRRAHVFVMTLSHSRHQYVEFVFDQTVATWLGVHRRAFEFFGGAPKKIVLDNLKAAIVKACLYEPVVQRAYRELAEHYGFLISPCRPGRPRHKGKVERGGVSYVKNNLLAGRSFRNLQEANEQGMAWVLEVAGRRVHGTTKQVPLEVFAKREQEALLPLPEEPLLLCCYQQPKVHRDCHVVFEGSYYSAPFRLVGQQVLLKATEQQVELYHRHHLVAVHSRADEAGERVTQMDHLPPHKAEYLTQTPAWCCQRAAEIGPAVSAAMECLRESRPVDRTRPMRGLLRLAERYGEQRLEAACVRCLEYEEVRYATVKRILEKGLDKEAALRADTGSCLSRPKYARSAIELFSPAVEKQRDETMMREASPTIADAGGDER